MQKFDSPAPVSAVLDIPAGRIRLIAADRTDTTVEVLPADPSKSRDVKAAEHIEIAHADGVLRIEAPTTRNRILGQSGSVEVTVQLPAGSRVQAKAAAADLRGPADISTQKGDLRIAEAVSGAVALRTEQGDITARSL